MARITVRELNSRLRVRNENYVEADIREEENGHAYGILRLPRRIIAALDAAGLDVPDLFKMTPEQIRKDAKRWGISHGDARLLIREIFSVWGEEWAPRSGIGLRKWEKLAR